MAGVRLVADPRPMTIKSTLHEPIGVAYADDVLVRPDPSTGHLRLVLNGDPLEDDETVTVAASVLARLVDHRPADATHPPQSTVRNMPQRTGHVEPEPWLNFLPRLRGYPSGVTRA